MIKGADIDRKGAGVVQRKAGQQTSLYGLV